MKYNLWFFSIFVLLTLVSCNRSERIVPEALRSDSYELLVSTMNYSTEWKKVHAAEYLIQLGYKDTVYQYFKVEATKEGDQLVYRIGIWRTLAFSSPSDSIRNIWITKIQQVNNDTLNADRIHALESLSKLQVAADNPHVPIERIVSENRQNRNFIFALWNAIYNGDDPTASENQLVEFTSSPAISASTRRLSAYILSNLKGISLENRKKIDTAFENESDTSAIYPYLLGLHIRLASDDSASAVVERLKPQIVNLLTASPDKVQPYVIDALSSVHDKNFIAELTPYINNAQQSVIDEDIRSAAANYLLTIDRAQKYTLVPIDWVVICLYLLLMLYIGWYYSKRSKNTEDFFLGGRNMSSVLVGISLFTTMLSSLSYLSYPSEMIKYGPGLFVAMLIFPVIYYVVGWLIIPKFMEYNVTSAYELLERRLGVSVRLLAVFFFLTLRFLWMATLIYATVHTALLAVVDIPAHYTNLISIVLLIVTLIYASMGGYKAVVITDVMQSVIMWLGAILAIVYVCLDFNSLTAWFPSQYLGHWEPMSWKLDPQMRGTVANAMLYYLIWNVCTSGSDQMAIQRYLSTKNVRAARKSFGTSLIFTFMIKIFLALVGLAIFAYFSKHTQYMGSGESLHVNADQLFPKFIAIGLPVGISGLIIVALLSAAMSSISSGLNSTATVIHEDIIKRLMPSLNHRIKDPLKLVKQLSLIVGVLILLLSMLMSNVQGNLLDVIIKVVNLFTAPLFVLFFMAIFVKKSTSAGTIIGGVISVAIAVAIGFFGVGGITSLWIMPFSLLGGVCAGLTFSYIDIAFRRNP